MQFDIFPLVCFTIVFFYYWFIILLLVYLPLLRQNYVSSSSGSSFVYLYLYLLLLHFVISCIQNVVFCVDSICYCCSLVFAAAASKLCQQKQQQSSVHGRLTTATPIFSVITSIVTIAIITTIIIHCPQHHIPLLAGRIHSTFTCTNTPAAVSLSDQMD